MRKSLDAVLIESAHVWSQRSTCSRLHVGCVIACDSRIVSTGYNGAPSGLRHCEHQQPPADSSAGGCSVSVHAEANAIAFAARRGLAVEGATLYSTHQPCLGCAQLIVNAGIARVVYQNPYRLQDGLILLSEVGVDVFRFW